MIRVKLRKKIKLHKYKPPHTQSMPSSMMINDFNKKLIELENKVTEHAKEIREL